MNCLIKITLQIYMIIINIISPKYNKKVNIKKTHQINFQIKNMNCLIKIILHISVLIRWNY